MRKRIVAGNWKCNTTIQEGHLLAERVNQLVIEKGAKDVQVVLGVPFTHLTGIVALVNADLIQVAAQNCAAEAKGAYTGEVSAMMVKSTGARYVIIGHSERREYYGETADVLNKKIELALSNDLIPIYCCGEALQVRTAAGQNQFVKKQLEDTIFGLSADNFSKLVIAYEPIWAIGTGVTATTEQAQEMMSYIRSLIRDKYGATIASQTSLLYGGSCNAGNAAELFAQPDIDGGLIGGASLKADEFIQIVNAY